ncbi:hypothetical protein BDV93DRAFT_548194 [Ceratobasidium sp. AG-I]|nr:hypothetical protein BDV93DRAFT_548194 [Ceratobasidium sp. AG-I]
MHIIPTHTSHNIEPTVPSHSAWNLLFLVPNCQHGTLPYALNTNLLFLVFWLNVAYEFLWPMLRKFLFEPDLDSVKFPLKCT